MLRGILVKTDIMTKTQDKTYRRSYHLGGKSVLHQGYFGQRKRVRERERKWQEKALTEKSKEIDVYRREKRKKKETKIRNQAA